MLNRYKNSDPFATLRSFHSLASAFGFGQPTADKREIKDFPKFAYWQLLLSANRYIQFGARILT
jgi:hypothetical protein